jgi:hypothetical protein
MKTCGHCLCVGMIARARDGGDGAEDGERGHGGDHGQASRGGTGAGITALSQAVRSGGGQREGGRQAGAWNCGRPPYHLIE